MIGLCNRILLLSQACRKMGFLLLKKVDAHHRLLNKCQARDIVTMCKKLQLLPANHFGARPGCTTTDLIHLLTKTVKDAWRKNQVASALFLDVKSAFPSMDIARLIHNMRKRGIPKQYTNWLLNRYRNRHTNLSFDGDETCSSLQPEIIFSTYSRLATSPETALIPITTQLLSSVTAIPVHFHCQA